QGMLRFATAAAAALFIVVVAGDLALIRVGTGGGLAAERQSAPPATPLDAAAERGTVDATSLASEAATPGSGGQAALAATLAPEATPSPSPEPPAAFTASSDTSSTPSPIPDESFKDTSGETTAKARSIEAAPQPPADLRDRREGRPLLRWAEAVLAGAFVLLLALTLVGRRRASGADGTFRRRVSS
ncbi:MAG: hypothetical protein HY681_04555, partial [Chloroflexi bacterium]|nr:hypothetical protein [Chloroflexota bacterium]